MEQYDLEHALTKRKRKGLTKNPCNGWYVEENLHEWAVEKGYLTGAIFKKPKTYNKKTTWKYALLLVGACPWTPGNLRYYAISL